MRGCRAGCARTPGDNHTAIAPITTATATAYSLVNSTQEYTPSITSYCLQIIQMIAIAIAITIIIATPAAFVLVLLLLKLVGVLASTSTFNFNP
jgi:hypothetical protein